MDIILQIGVVFAVCLAGELVSALLPFTFPASVIAMLPTLLLFFFFQRYIIESMALSGVKG